MIREASAVVHLRLLSEREAKTMYKALKPETEASPTRRFKVQVAREGKDLTLIFESRDTIALRASMNSYLRWLHLLNSVYGTLESL